MTNTTGDVAREYQGGKGKKRGGRAEKPGVDVICLCYDYEPGTDAAVSGG